ncbi:MAG: septal ring lytic transglycosylase RlpA family protein [Gammaproteobacteria bacterium]|nr:septal ring lytic transglycosylase RlpA family protein [Gammaproteobacteria bacterium]
MSEQAIPRLSGVPRSAWLLVASALLLTGCGTLRRAPEPLPPAKPGAATIADAPRQLAAIPDAVPRKEPLSRYGNPETYEVFGRTYRVKRSARGHVERGTASWYGPGFHAERTSSGEPYDMYAMTAAHKTLPIPAYVRVTNLDNGRSVVVRVNDRGPFVGERIIDLSYTAAWKLDMLRQGTAPVEIRVLEPGEDPPAVSTSALPSAPTPAPTPASTAASTAASSRASPPATGPIGIGVSSRYLQAGSFASRANAETVIGNLAGAGIRNVVIREARVGERQVFRVQVGPLDGAIEADDMVERLRLAGVPDARPAHE